MEKIVLITGASSGIGKATAKLLAREGFKVIGAARSIERMEDLKSVGVIPYFVDVTDERSMRSLVDYIIDEYGRIDVLINNAGFGMYGPLESISMEDAREQLEVNVFGAMRLIQLCLPYMRKQKSGRIINISSIGGKISTPFGGWYHASKFALEALSDSLRNEVKPFGIDVVVVEPGGVKSEWSETAYEQLILNATIPEYTNMTERFAVSFKRMIRGNSEPLVIANLISHALHATNPKTRYVGAHMAKTILWMRRLLPDSLFDRLLMSQLK